MTFCSIKRPCLGIYKIMLKVLSRLQYKTVSITTLAWLIFYKEALTFEKVVAFYCTMLFHQHQGQKRSFSKGPDAQRRLFRIDNEPLTIVI